MTNIREIWRPDQQNGQSKTVKSKRAASEKPEVVEVIAALLRGEDVERTLSPWTGKFALEEWNKVVAQTGDFDWELVLRIFNVLKEKSVFAVQSVSLRDLDNRYVNDTTFKQGF